MLEREDEKKEVGEEFQEQITATQDRPVNFKEALLAYILSNVEQHTNITADTLKFAELYLLSIALHNPKQFEAEFKTLTTLLCDSFELKYQGNIHLYHYEEELFNTLKENLNKISQSTTEALKDRLNKLYAQMQLPKLYVRAYGLDIAAQIPERFIEILKNKNITPLRAGGLNFVNTDILTMLDLLESIKTIITTNPTPTDDEVLLLERVSDRIAALNYQLRSYIEDQRRNLLHDITKILVDQYDSKIATAFQVSAVHSFKRTSQHDAEWLAKCNNAIVAIIKFFTSSTQENKEILIKLNQSLKDRLAQHTKIDTEFQPLLQLLSDFLDKERLPYQNLSPTGVVLELLSYIIVPSSLNQKDTTLCGISSIMSSLLNNSPAHFVMCCLELAEKGSTRLITAEPIPRSIQQDVFIYDILLSAIKNVHNKTGYDPSGIFSKARGLTRPKEMSAILAELGFSNIENFTLIYNSKSTGVVSDTFLTLLGGAHGENYILKADLKDNLMHLIAKIQNGHSAIMLVGMKSFCDNILSINYSEDTLVSKVLGIEDLHYVYVKELSLSEDNQINLTIETYGKSYRESMPLETFFKMYRGAITADPKTLYELAAEASERPER